jgi:hypothetical protein
MTDKKIDYRAEGSLFLKLKADGEKVNHVSFCKRRSGELGEPLSLAYFRKVLRSLKGKNKPLKKGKNAGNLHKRVKKTKVNPAKKSTDGVDWSALKTEFMDNSGISLAAFARDHGMNPASGMFRRNTTGWPKERRSVIAETSTKAVQTLIESRAADKARDMYAEILAFQWRLMDALKEAAESVPQWKTIKSPYTAGAVATYALNMQVAFEKLMPNLQGLVKMDEMRNIFDGLADNTMDIEQAAIGFVKLGVQMPEPLKMMLQKYEPEEPMPDDNDEITEAQIMARREEMLKEIEVERIEFVAERKKAVKQITHELAHVESFTENSDGPTET